MSTVGMSFANKDYDAAQALLDLQSNFRQTENYDRKESIETANLFLSCFIASNVSKEPVASSTKVGTVNPMYAVAKSTTRKSDIATTDTPKRKTPDQELTRARPNNAYHPEESSNKRSKIFKRKPIKHFTVTSGPVSNFSAMKVTQSAKKDNRNNVIEMKVKTRDVGTQTEEKYPLPMIQSMELTISELCEEVKSLREQIKSNSQQPSQNNASQTMDQRVSDNDNDFDDDDDDSYKPNSHEMTMDDSNASDSWMDETFTEPETPKNVKPKHKVGPYNGYNNTPNVLSNRNVIANADDLVPIGDGNALIPARIFRHVNWNSYTSATRKLLTTVFSRRVLATHSLTGKPSPAFPNKPAKKKLDAALVNDIVQTVVERCCVPENVVRTSITTKCADESKMFRTRENNKNKRKQRVNRENIPPESDSDEF